MATEHEPAGDSKTITVPSIKVIIQARRQSSSDVAMLVIDRGVLSIEVKVVKGRGKRQARGVSPKMKPKAGRDVNRRRIAVAKQPRMVNVEGRCAKPCAGTQGIQRQPCARLRNFVCEVVPAE